MEVDAGFIIALIFLIAFGIISFVLSILGVDCTEHDL